MKRSKKKTLIISVSIILSIVTITFCLLWYHARNFNDGVSNLNLADFSEKPSLSNFIISIQKAIKMQRYSKTESVFQSFSKNMKTDEDVDPEYDRLLLKILTACLLEKDDVYDRINVVALELHKDLPTGIDLDDVEYYQELFEETPSVQIRSLALEILGKLGKRATPTIPAICFVAHNDKAPSIRCEAIETLESIVTSDFLEVLLKLIAGYDKLVVDHFYGEFIFIFDDGSMLAPATDERIYLTLKNIPKENYQEQQILENINWEACIFDDLGSLLAKIATKDQIFALIKNPNKKIRAVAIWATYVALDIDQEMTDTEMENAKEHTIDIMFNILKNDPDPFVRVCAAMRICAFQYYYNSNPFMRKTDVGRRLMAVLKTEKHPAVRMACIQAGAFDIKNNLSTYLTIVQDKKETPFARAAAANAFKYLCDNRDKAIEKNASTILLSLAFDSNNPPFFRYYAFFGSIAVASPATEEIIIKLLRNKKLTKTLDSYSESPLFELMHSPKAADFLIELFNDPKYFKGRYWIVSCLGENGSSKAIEAIVQKIDVILNDNGRNMKISHLFRSDRGGETLLKVYKILKRTQPSLAQRLLNKLEWSKNHELQKYIRKTKQLKIANKATSNK